MRSIVAAAAMLVLGAGIVPHTGYGQSPQVDLARLQAAVDEQSQWLATSREGPGWNQFLRIPQLRQQLAAQQPDRSAIEQILERYRSKTPGLEQPAFARVRVALERWLASMPVDVARLPELAEQAKTSFVTVQAADAAKARAALETAAARLDRYLAGQGANGARWRTFLRVDDLRNQLATGDPDQETLAESSKKFSSGYFGLHRPAFYETGAALREYLRLARAAANPAGAEEYAADIERLTALLEPLSTQPSTEVIDEASAILGRLRATGQAPQLVTAMRSAYARPNLFLRVSDDFLARGFAEHVDEVMPVRDFIEGTSIRGSARTIGDVTLTLVPHHERAVLQAVFGGFTYTKTTGANGPARIYSSGTTRLSGRQSLYIDADGVSTYPSTSDAQTSIRTTGIGSTSPGIRGCIVERVASKRVAQAKPNAERITSGRAETRLNQRLADRVNEFVAQANDRYWSQVRQPLTEKGQFPEAFLIRSTADELFVSGVAAGPSQLGAPSSPPPLAGDPDMAIRLHESAVNNFAQGVLAGETLHSERVRDEMTEILGELPERFADEEGKAPWSITFADEKPLEVTFADDGFTIVIRGKQYTADDRTYRAMNVTAVYKIESGPDGLKAVRQGDLQIFPPGFVPGERRFSVPEQTLRSILERRFGKLLTPEIGGDLLQPPGRFKNLGPLRMTNFAAQQGWITLGWVPQTSPKPVLALAR